MSVKYQKISSNMSQSISKENGDQDVLLNSNVIEVDSDLSKSNNGDIQFAKINIDDVNNDNNNDSKNSILGSNDEYDFSANSLDSSGILPSPQNKDKTRVFTKEDHNLMLKETVNVIKKLIVIGINSNFWYSARLYVWILYAQSFFGGKKSNEDLGIYIY